MFKDLRYNVRTRLQQTKFKLGPYKTHTKDWNGEICKTAMEVETHYKVGCPEQTIQIATSRTTYFFFEYHIQSKIRREQQT